MKTVISILICVSIVIVLGANIGLALAIGALDVYYGDGPIEFIKETIKESFRNRNLFGWILSCIVTVLFIPGVILGLVLFVVINIPRLIWRLGDRR